MKKLKEILKDYPDELYEEIREHAGRMFILGFGLGVVSLIVGSILTEFIYGVT